MAAGAYSSIFIATPLLVHLKAQRDRGRARPSGAPRPGARRDADRYAAVPAFTEDMPVARRADGDDAGASRSTTTSPTARRSAPSRAPEASGRGRVVPTAARARSATARPSGRAAADAGSRGPSAARSERGDVTAARARRSSGSSSTSRTSRSPGSSSRTSPRCWPTTTAFTRGRRGAGRRPAATSRRARVVDKVVGMEARGFILAAPVALALGVGFVPVRKAGKLPRRDARGRPTPWSTARRPSRSTRTRSRRGSGCCSSTTCWPPAAPSPRPASWSSAAAATRAGVAVLMELGFLPGRDADRRPAADRAADGLTASHAAPRLDRVTRGPAATAPSPRRRPAERRRERPPTSRRVPPSVAACAPGWPGSAPAASPATRSSSRCSASVRANHPKADLALLERAYHDRREDARHPDAQERRPLHHPPARGDHDPRRHRHDRADPGRRAAARHGRGHAVHPRRSCARTSATRSPCSSTA